ncbi:DUF7322 domain-containing protein [Haloarchaeobius sp. TZWWS8]|uniref:DUF7322 domain-containing protein n=1 Tax=Haloarchaeobius sp. TZWWS8 TaxID=3446121 RepID=UPI003EB933FC
MFNERSEHEPEEHDPEDDLRDWEGELTPSVRIPEAPNYEDVDVPGDISFEFWRMVIAFNGALLGLSVGVMFVLFDGNWSLGGRIFLAGLVFFAYGAYRFWKFENQERTDDADTSDDSPADSVSEPDGRDD